MQQKAAFWPFPSITTKKGKRLMGIKVNVTGSCRGVIASFPSEFWVRTAMSSTLLGRGRLQSSSTMISKDQLLHLFTRFSALTSQPSVKKRIRDAVDDKQEAVAVTTAIQEEIFQEMGVDPRFGISCLGKVNSFYETDQDLMIQFYKFVAIEEMACDEAELDPEEFGERMNNQKRLHEQQLEMLKAMRKCHLDDQLAILEKLRRQLENTEYDGGASLLSSEELKETVPRRISPSILQNRP